MNSPSLLLFDLGGVLVESTAFDHLNRLLPKPISTIHIKERWLNSPSVRQFERGQLPALEFANLFLEEWKLSVSTHTFLEEFSTWPRALYPGAKELIQDLRRYYRVGCLSNSNPLHWAALKDEIENLFDIVLCSHLLGSVKPDQAIFVRALQECNVQPRDIYFFDDCLANVRAAHGLNINAFCVNGFSSVLHILQLHGLLSLSWQPDFFVLDSTQKIIP